MKKFSFIYTLASALMMGAVALSGLTSCSSSDDAVADVKPDVKPETKYVYKINITAGFADNEEGTRAVEFAGNSSTAKFVAGEKIHLYKVTKSIEDEVESYDLLKNVADDNDYITLKSEDISSTDGGRSCTIQGTLSSSEEIKNDDVLVLMYNMTDAGTSAEDSYFNYDDNGYSYNVLDGATARVQVALSGTTITGVNTVDNAGTIVSGGSNRAIFTNAQSMFRLNFQFLQSNGTTAIDKVTLKQLVVASPSIASEYYPLMSYDGGDGNFPYHLESNIAMRFSGDEEYNSGDPIYLSLCFDETMSKTGDKLIFIAQDNNNEYYRGEKSAPTGGFKNGKYYRSTSGATINMRKIYTFSPFVLTGDESPVNPLPLSESYTDTWSGETITKAYIKFGGASVNYRFTLPSASYNIKLDGLLSLYNADGSPFISSNGNLILDIMDDTNIYCNFVDADPEKSINNSKYCIETTGSLKLRGKGKLILITRTAGIKADGNKTSGETPTTIDYSGNSVVGLADDGYTVSCTRTDNSGLITWTYVVGPTPSPAP